MRRLRNTWPTGTQTGGTPLDATMVAITGLSAGATTGTGWFQEGDAPTGLAEKELEKQFLIIRILYGT